jgi:hypothetical protein
MKMLQAWRPIAAILFCNQRCLSASDFVSTQQPKNKFNMNNILSFRFPTVLAALLLALGLVTRAQAQATGNVALLEQAYTALAQADHDYKGHRAKAMKHIEQAVNELGGKIKGDGKGREPQATSDAQLRAAKGLLQQAVPNLSGKALRHVNNAIKEIDEALAVK